MLFFEALALAFFRTFGITEPTARKRRVAVYFLMSLLCVLAACFLAGAAILFHML